MLPSPNSGATSSFETPLSGLLRMRLQRLCPHPEEDRRSVSKDEVARCSFHKVK